MSLPIGTVNCAFCGQCTVVCPVGALKETSAKKDVWDALENPKRRTVVQVAPAVRVAIGEEFGLDAGTRVTGKLAAALRKLGFADVFDTDFAADLTIMEEGTEFLKRITNAVLGKKTVLPMLTSCSPGWMKFVEHNFPDYLEHLSTCKSPHTMLGAVVKSYYAQQTNTDPKDMFVVSIMPCTAKKFEIVREEMKNDEVANVDAVLTTRELADMIKSAGIDFARLEEEEFDHSLGMSTGAGDIFGLTGGVMEAALRTVYELVTGRELPFEGLHVMPIEGFDQVKEASFVIEDPLEQYDFLNHIEVRIAVTSGLAGAKKLMQQMKDGDSPYHFIEVMGCPGGCIMGGGQPRSEDTNVKEKRLRGLYAEDESKALRKSHQNPYVLKLYEDFLGEPNGHLAHELLHTSYVKRGIFNELTDKTYCVQPDTPIKSKAQKPGVVKYSYSDELRRAREETESPKIIELEAVNQKLEQELAEAYESIEVLKAVVMTESENTR